MQLLKYIVKGDTLELGAFGDLHWGHINCDKDMILNVVKYLKKNKCYWLGGGDYGDAIIPSDYRFDYRSIDPEYNTPQKQYAKMEELFKPISDKCLGLLDGNHDVLHWKKHAHNYVEELASRINVPYLTIDSYIRFYFKKFNTAFNLYAHHGWTGARTKGGKISRLYDLEAIFPMCNLYLMFHIHDLGIVDKKANLYIEETKDGLEIRDQISYFMFGGSYLRGYVADRISYVEEKTYRPTVLGAPILTIKARKGKNTVNFDITYREIR